MNRYTPAKGLLTLCAVLLLACGCAAPSESGDGQPSSSSSVSSAPAASQEEPDGPSWEDYQLLDMAGEPVLPWSEEITAVQLSYAYGWEPGREGVLRLEEDRYSPPVWGNAKVTGASSVCRLLRGEDGLAGPQCFSSGYALDCQTAIPGILQLDSGGVLLFPYKGSGLSLPRLEPRDSERESALLDHAVLSLTDGTTLEIEPLAIELPDEWDRNVILEELGIGGLDGLSSPRWYDVEVDLEYISAVCRLDSQQAVSTRFTASLERTDSLAVKEELTLSAPVWTGFAPWDGQPETPEPSDLLLWEGSLSEDGELLDPAGEPIAPWSADLFLLELSYACGWDLDHDGYLRLDDGQTAEEWGVAQPLEAGSSYYIYPKYTGSRKLGLSQNSYQFIPQEAVPGVLQVDHYSVLFYPYRSVRQPFLRVEPRTKDREKELRDAAVLSLTDGTTLEIKPVAVQLPWEQDKEALLRLLGIDPPDEAEPPRWFDVELRLSSVEVAGYSDNMWEVLATRTLAAVAQEEPLTVKGELFLTQRVWPGFAYWVYQPDWPER